MLSQLHEIEKRLDILKPRLHDELDNKHIVTSDKEFDDANVDPRYENSKYKSSNVKSEPSTPLTVPKPSINGLYKGSQMNDLKLAQKRREEMQAAKIESQIRDSKERHKFLKSKDDSAISVSRLNQSIKKTKEHLTKVDEREKERLRKLADEPVRSCFDYVEGYSNYHRDVVSNKINGLDDNYDPVRDPAFDIYSRMYVSKFYFPEDVIKSQMKDTHVLRIPNLFSKLPAHLEELRESNFIVTGVVSAKSEPILNPRKTSKYIRIRLSNFKVDILLYLYDDAYKKYWKISPGSIIALLNPKIEDIGYYSNKNGSSSAANYVLKVSESTTILEYAKFRDIGYCPGTNNKPCQQLVNKKESAFCHYHQQKRTDKTASHRNEMGTNYRLFDPVDARGNKQVMVMTEKQIEQSELVIDNNKNNKSTGLAIENVARNPPLRGKENINTELLITDFSNPTTLNNLKTEEEKQRVNFTSSKANAAFFNADKVNKYALIKQEKDRKLDKKLMSKKLELDSLALKDFEKKQTANEYKKRQKLHGKETIQSLMEASRTEKSLRKDRETVEKRLRENKEIEEHNRLYTMNKRRQLVDAIDSSKYSETTKLVKKLETEVELSSDDDSDEFENLGSIRKFL